MYLSSVRIVHGKGIGALLKAVHGLLKRTKTIAEYHLGEFGEGDAGAVSYTHLIYTDDYDCGHAAMKALNNYEIYLQIRTLHYTIYS